MEQCAVCYACFISNAHALKFHFQDSSMILHTHTHHPPSLECTQHKGEMLTCHHCAAHESLRRRNQRRWPTPFLACITCHVVVVSRCFRYGAGHDRNNKILGLCSLLVPCFLLVCFWMQSHVTSKTIQTFVEMCGSLFCYFL